MKTLGRTSISIIIFVTICMLFNATVFAVSTNSQAETLKKLNLLKGSNLDSSLTRAQGAVVLLRLLGMEAAAEKANMKSSFKDVAGKHWAEKYIAFAFQKGFVKGTGKTTFSPDKEISGKQFITYVLRALGYAEAAPGTAVSLSVSSNLLTLDRALSLTSKSHFLRSDMVEVTYNALKTKLKSKDLLLAEMLINNNIIQKDLVENTDLLGSKDPLMQIEDAISKKVKEEGVRSKKD